MQKLSNFLEKSSAIIKQQTRSSVQSLLEDIQKNGQETEPITTRDLTAQIKIDQISLDKPLENIDLQQSKVIALQSNVYQRSQLRKSKGLQNQKKELMGGSRIKQIQGQKKKILEELRKLDGQIAQIKQQKDGVSLQKSQYHKKIHISDDIQAKKQAQSLVKQLHLQKIKMDEKKRKQQEKELEMHKREEQLRKKQNQEIQRKIKESKRLIIQKRMQQDKKKRLERQIVDKQSNQLISQLKKQEELQKQSELIPSKIQEYEQKKKLLEKKNIFNYGDIEEHQKKYKKLKSMEKQLRRERSQSIKVSHPVPKYGKNIWVERIQEEQIKRKQEEKIKQLNRRKQLEKRMQYGDIVKNIFMSKNKKKQESIQKTSKQQSVFQAQVQMTQAKPRTPDTKSHLPFIPRSDLKRQNLTDKKFKQRHASNSIIQNKKSRIVSKPQQIKQKDPLQHQKIQKQKQREQQLRKQTKQRLKKLENNSIEVPKSQKIKYENYMGKVKVKRQDPHDEWKRIMSNDNLSKEQKYKQMLSRAAFMQNQAKIKEDLRKNGDEDAVNLYIGSIQAKLALLQKF